MVHQNTKLEKYMNKILLEKKMYSLNAFIDKQFIVKDGNFETTGSAKATYNNYILCYAVTLKYIQKADNNPHISCIITNKELADEVKNKAVAIAEEPDMLFGQIVNHLIEAGKLTPSMDFGIDKTAIIHSTAIISDKCKIGKNVIVGRNSIIEDYTILEDNVIIGDNVVIGCDGFYFKRDKAGKLIKFLHAGGVHLQKNVEVMTGSMVQRAHDANFTIVGEGTKISVNVNIGHSSHIGKHNMITGNVQIAGRATIGDNCWIGTSSTISDSVVIGNNAEIKIGSIVVKNVKDNEIVSGNFAILHSTNLKNYIKAQR